MTDTAWPLLEMLQQCHHSMAASTGGATLGQIQEQHPTGRDRVWPADCGVKLSVGLLQRRQSLPAASISGHLVQHVHCAWEEWPEEGAGRSVMTAR